MMASALGAQQQRAYFNRFAQRPEWSQIELDIASPAFKREVSAYLEIAGIPERSLILDFGCGRGLWSLALARLGHTVVSIDVSERSIEPLARAGLVAPPGHILPIVGTPPALGASARAKFDAVVCVDVLHHVEDIPATVHWMVSLLRPGGVFASLEPNARFPFWRLMPWIIPGFDWAYEHGVVRCRKEYLADTLRNAGGADVRVAHWKLFPGNLAERFPYLKRIENIALKFHPLRDRSFFLMIRCVA